MLYATYTVNANVTIMFIHKKCCKNNYNYVVTYVRIYDMS